MLAIKGVYENGKIALEKKVKTTKPVSVIVTFLEDLERPGSRKLDVNKFSFNKCKDLLKEYKGSLSDAVIEERRSAL